jgi:hypothetical protein
MDWDARWDKYMRMGSPYRSATPNVRIIAEYFQLINAILGTYLDMITSMNIVLSNFERQQEQMAKKDKMAVEKLDEMFIVYEPIDPDPRNQHSRPIHMCSQGGYKKRNALGGCNQRIAGNMCIVLIYQYWEDYYRGKIAEIVKVKKDDIKLDIMGDLRTLRRSIIHNRGIAIEECKILKWFGAGEEINVELDQFGYLVYHVEKGLSELSQELEFKIASES